MGIKLLHDLFVTFVMVSTAQWKAVSRRSAVFFNRTDGPWPSWLVTLILQRNVPAIKRAARQLTYLLVKVPVRFQRWAWPLLTELLTWLLHLQVQCRLASHHVAVGLQVCLFGSRLRCVRQWPPFLLSAEHASQNPDCVMEFRARVLKSQPGLHSKS